MREKDLGLRQATSSLSDEKNECQVAMGLEQGLIARVGSKKAAKNIILTNYVNEVFYGRNAYTPEEAAKQYFGTTAKKLTLPQAILLAGVINRPSEYDVAFSSLDISKKAEQAYKDFAVTVKLDPDESAGLPERQVIKAADAAVAKGALDKTQRSVIVTYAMYRLESLNLRNRYGLVVAAMEKNQPTVVTHAKAEWLRSPENFPTLKPYTPPVLTQVSHKGGDSLGARHFTDFVVQEAIPLISKATGTAVDRSDILSGRYTIHTCLDTRDQKALTNAVLSAQSIQGLDAAAVSLDSTGCIRAMLGSKDYKKTQVNIAVGRLGGGSGRSPGSSLKPYALATALEEGLSPNTKLTIPSTVSITSRSTASRSRSVPRLAASTCLRASRAAR
jgi:membrane peptidoglycan carboxypeptidase